MKMQSVLNLNKKMSVATNSWQKCRTDDRSGSEQRLKGLKKVVFDTRNSRNM